MTTHIICGSFGISDVAVEIGAKSRFIFQRANPATDTFPGVDHSVANDVFELTEQHITDIGPIALCIRAPPCGDFCKLRLFLADGTTIDHHLDPRPGLDGPQGRIFRQYLVVLSWVLNHNPSAEFLVENLVFDDMSEDWTEVC
jgi:hypothetical protein